MAKKIAKAAAPSVFSLAAIKAQCPAYEALLERLASSFVALSEERIGMGAVGHLSFDGRNGEACIKSAFCRGGETWVVKVAGGFYDNPQQGLPSSVGLMMVLDQRIGVPRAVLLDEGYLTDLRTALAACVSVKALAPKKARAIGLVGAGTISRLLVSTLHTATNCRDLRVWARRAEAAEALCAEARPKWSTAAAASSVAELVAETDVIVCCTPSREPLLLAKHLAGRPASAPGLHITALGSDGVGKQEVEAALVAQCDLVVPDSLKQCFGFGECAHAKAAGLLAETDAKVVELGALLSAKVELQRSSCKVDARLTLADSTGVGASDLCIAEAVYCGLVPGAPPLPKAEHRWKGQAELQSRL